MSATELKLIAQCNEEITSKGCKLGLLRPYARAVLKDEVLEASHPTIQR